MDQIEYLDKFYKDYEEYLMPKCLLNEAYGIKSKYKLSQFKFKNKYLSKKLNGRFEIIDALFFNMFIDIVGLSFDSRNYILFKNKLLHANELDEKLNYIKSNKIECQNKMIDGALGFSNIENFPFILKNEEFYNSIKRLFVSTDYEWFYKLKGKVIHKTDDFEELLYQIHETTEIYDKTIEPIKKMNDSLIWNVIEDEIQQEKDENKFYTKISPNNPLIFKSKKGEAIFDYCINSYERKNINQMLLSKIYILLKLKNYIVDVKPKIYMEFVKYKLNIKMNRIRKDFTNSDEVNKLITIAEENIKI